MQGICSVCQEPVEIHPSDAAIREMAPHGYDLETLEHEFGEEIHYLCVPHSAYGKYCEGSGQIPQTILKHD